MEIVKKILQKGFFILFLTLGCTIIALLLYIELFRASVLPFKQRRVDIQRYDKSYKNILVLGDSFFDPRNPGIFELQMKLRKERGVDFQNLSEAGAGPLHHLYALEYYLEKYPYEKAVIIFYGGNDLVDLHAPIDERHFKARLRRREGRFEAIYILVREVFRHYQEELFPSEDRKDIFLYNMRGDRNYLLINDLLLKKEETLNLFEKFYDRLSLLVENKGLKLGCLYIPASRSISDKLFSFWKEQQAYWDKDLEFNKASNEVFSQSLPKICSWFYEDLTPIFKEELRKEKPVYLSKDPHLTPDYGHKILLKTLEENILK